MARILVVDDDASVRDAAARLLAGEGDTVETASTVAEAVRRIGGPWDAAVVDLGLPDGSGMEVLKASTEADAARPVIVVTGQGSIRAAVEAMRAGARDFVEKPFDPDDLRLRVRRALDEAALRRERDDLRREAARLRGIVEGGYRGIIGAAPSMRRLFDEIERAAPTASTILVTGESGTGKELVARAIHAASSRRGRFVAVNCAAIPETLLEGELFGYERGAFTGAVRAKPGLFETADRGTILLDEVGDIPPSLQAKLLRVIQDGEVTRLGATAPVRLDVRLVAATHRDLRAMVDAGRFREDLYYRLAVIPMHLPPLRDRREDVAPIAAAILGRLSGRRGGRPLILSPEALDSLETRAWPGNVRELENALERAAALVRGETILPADLGAVSPPASSMGGVPGASAPAAAENGDDPRGLTERVADLERGAIHEALRRSEGNQFKAARSLGLSRQTLQYKIRKYRIKPSK